MLEELRPLGRSLHVDCQGLGLVFSKDVDLDRPLIFQLWEYGGKYGRITEFDPIDPFHNIAGLKPELSVKAIVIDGFQQDPLRSSIHNKWNRAGMLIHLQGI